MTFINPGKEGERFWDMVTETMQAAASDLDIELEVLYAQRNRLQMKQLGIAATQRPLPPDYLILVNEEQAAVDILEAAADSQIPTLMLLNDFLPSQRQRVGFPGGKHPHLLGAVTPDNYAAGRRMMQALAKCSRENNPDSSDHHILMIAGDRLTPASIDRNNGAIAALESDPRLKLDRLLFANWNRTEARQLTINYLNWAERNNLRPGAIWAANDPIAAGAAEALQARNLQAGQDLCLVGLNWSAEGLDMVHSGTMVLTDGGHFLAGAWSMIALYDYQQRRLAGDSTPVGELSFDMQSIDATLVQDYRDTLGDERWEKIDFRSFTLSGKDRDHYDFSLPALFSSVRS
ncbi:ABC transporter substrate-binding protein [Marinobacterium jannaschii]|uniref:ABC transporter substrate-binding protein n=1 Tax=Marinobacterium jannaschii TaxID=64970 RepID=UPI00147123EC|nr:ABC transporter substrate-binding protein [Marinobacterium jannaschii]